MLANGPEVVYSVLGPALGLEQRAGGSVAQWACTPVADTYDTYVAPEGKLVLTRLTGSLCTNDVAELIGHHYPSVIFICNEPDLLEGAVRRHTMVSDVSWVTRHDRARACQSVPCRGLPC